MRDPVRDQLITYLEDAHSIEEQALQQLRAAPEIARDEAFAAALQAHLRETEGHETRIRALLEERGAKPSRTKDVVLRAGGSGFTLFARSQVDTPGKFAAHALSFEALEWASYDLLARTAERAGDGAVVEAARSIQEEERAMMERIEGLFDRTVEASLREASGDELEEHLRRYLADAHAIETQSEQLLKSAPGLVDAPALAKRFDEHLEETRAQQEVVEARLRAVGGEPSRLKDAAMRLGAFNWGMFFGVQPDSSGKLAAFAYAFEHLEIGGYEQLRRVAERAGDHGTVAAVEGILIQERRAAGRFTATFDQAVEASLG